MIFRDIEALLRKPISSSYLLQLHSLILKSSLDHDPYIVSLFVSSASSISVYLARSVFDSLPIKPPVFARTSLLKAYTKTSKPIESFNLFSRMRNLGLKPDNFTYPFVIKACGQCSMIGQGGAVHSMILKTGFDLDKYILNTLLRVYSACGEIFLARKVFDEMSERNVVSWSSMIAGYVSCNCSLDAFEVFRSMKLVHQKPNSVTLVSLLSASTCLLDVIKGKSIHSYIIVNGMELDVSLGTAVIEMYSRCGHIDESLKVFESTSDKNLQTWTVMISGLADNGRGNDAVFLFNQMEQTGLKPDSISFSGILSACGHSGLVDAGKQFFDRMVRIHKIKPTIEHYGCMVDLFGRAGLIEEAYGVIKNMKMKPNAVIFRSFLGACKNHGRFICSDYNMRNLLIETEPRVCANYVLAATVSLVNGSWDDAAELRILAKEKGLKKVTGYSWAEKRH